MYMFHQANVVPTTIPGEDDMSLLQYWYHLVLEELSQYINMKDDTSPFGVKVRACPHSAFRGTA